MSMEGRLSVVCVLCVAVATLCALNVCATVDVCSPSFAGGAICNCITIPPYQVFYTCRMKGLTYVPRGYSSNATQLNLSNNSITNVYRGAFNNLRHLTILYLQANLIRTIEVGSFDGLMSLSELVLANNELISIQRGVFRHLPALETLDLSDNNIARIHRYAFITLPSISLIHLDKNPIECGCEEVLLREFFKLMESKLTVTKEVCAGLTTTGYCETGESLFNPSMSCYSCSEAVGLNDCGNQGVQICPSHAPVCYNQITYTDSSHLSVSGGCTNLITCLFQEQRNQDTCMSDTGTTTTCFFCDPDKLSNYFDETNTTKEFFVTLLITLDTHMTTDLEDPNSGMYKSFTSNLDTEVHNYLRNQHGAFKVDFVDLRLPNVTMTFRVFCATMWFNTHQYVMDAMAKALIDRRFNCEGVRTVQVVLSSGEAECPSETTEDSIYGRFVWPSTKPGKVSFKKCPHQLSDSTSTTYASRTCKIHSDTLSGSWVAPDVSHCPHADETSRELQNIAQSNINNDNVEAVSTSLSNLTSQWQKFESFDVDWSVEAISGILKTDLSKMSHAVIGNTFDIVNNLLFIEQDILRRSENEFDSSNRLITAVETLLDRIDVTSGDYTAVRDNIAGSVTGVTGRDFGGLGMSYQGAGNTALTDSPISYSKGETKTGDGHSGIVLPSSLLATIPSKQRNNVDSISISVFRDPKLFTSIAQTNETKMLPVEGGGMVQVERKINSNVIAANVPMVDIQDLKAPVVVTLHHFHRGENVSCVYWDSVGLRWSADGCSVNLTTDDYTVCHCDHLTNFALLMDVYGSVDSANALALQIISYVGCGLSLVGVILTLVTYLKFRKLRRGNPSRILMNLCLAIGLVDLVFLVGEQEYTATSVAGCKVVAVLLHYFLLSVMCWMAVEAFNMYLALVKVFDTYVAHFQLKSTLFGWALPIVVVVITLGINTTNNYGLQPGGICWLGRVPFYAAFLGPVCLLLIVNFIIYLLVIRMIVNRSSTKLTKTDTSTTAVRLRGAISLVFLLGLTWVFAMLAVDKFGIVFHYLFAVFNSLQGFFLFIFYCLWQKEARLCWSKVLPCRTSPYGKNISTDTHSKGDSSTIESSKTTKSNITSKEGSSEASKSAEESRPKATAFRGNWQAQVTVTRTSTSFV